MCFRSGDGPLEDEDCEILVFALGFGVEKTVDFLPPRSYWRLDPIDQGPVSSQAHRVLVAGLGDGGIIDVLRAALTGFDHGPFVDRFLDLTEPAVRLAALVLEERRAQAVQEGKSQEEIAHLLKEGYGQIQAGHSEAIGSIRTELKGSLRPGTDVMWTGKNSPFR